MGLIDEDRLEVFRQEIEAQIQEKHEQQVQTYLQILDESLKSLNTTFETGLTKQDAQVQRIFEHLSTEFQETFKHLQLTTSQQQGPGRPKTSNSEDEPGHDSTASPPKRPLVESEVRLAVVLSGLTFLLVFLRTFHLF